MTSEEYYMPWGDRDIEGEDVTIYKNRLYESIPVVLAYVLIYAGMVAFMFSRYTQSNLFWVIFTMIIIWGLLGILSISYIILHLGLPAGIALALIFILLQMLIMNVTIENEHQELINLINVRFVPTDHQP